MAAFVETPNAPYDTHDHNRGCPTLLGNPALLDASTNPGKISLDHNFANEPLLSKPPYNPAVESASPFVASHSPTVHILHSPPSATTPFISTTKPSSPYRIPLFSTPSSTPILLHLSPSSRTSAWPFGTTSPSAPHILPLNRCPCFAEHGSVCGGGALPSRELGLYVCLSMLQLPLNAHQTCR